MIFGESCKFCIFLIKSSQEEATSRGPLWFLKGEISLYCFPSFIYLSQNRPSFPGDQEKYAGVHHIFSHSAFSPCSVTNYTKMYCSYILCKPCANCCRGYKSELDSFLPSSSLWSHGMKEMVSTTKLSYADKNKYNFCFHFYSLLGLNLSKAF